MIYTLGHKATYLSAIADRGKIVKSGKFGDYPGGYALKTIEDAKRLLVENHAEDYYCIFGLLADWETDTEPDPNGAWWHVLINAAEIVVLDDEVVEDGGK